MTWNAGRFCNSFEGGIVSILNAANAAARTERNVDRSGPAAVTRLIRALRAERSHRHLVESQLADAQAELVSVYEQLESARRQLRQRPA